MNEKTIPEQAVGQARKRAFDIIVRHPDCIRDDVVLNDLINDIATALGESDAPLMGVQQTDAALVRALRFYADPKRYSGPNQRIETPDEYQPDNQPYLSDLQVSSPYDYRSWLSIQHALDRVLALPHAGQPTAEKIDDLERAFGAPSALTGQPVEGDENNRLRKVLTEIALTCSTRAAALARDALSPAPASPQPREGERERQITHLCNLIDECAEAVDRSAEDIGGGRGSLEVLREMVVASESIRSTLPPVIAEQREKS